MAKILLLLLLFTERSFREDTGKQDSSLND